MLPNHFTYNKDVEDIFIDDLLKKLQAKQFFNSSFFNNNDQKFLISSVNKINIHKGNLDISDICFIKKN